MNETEQNNMEQAVPAEEAREELQETVQQTAAVQEDAALTEEEMNKRSFMDDIEATLVRIRPGQTVTGSVVQVTDDEVCVNIGYKSDGLIKREDLSDKDVKVGDQIEVEVVKVNDGEGNVILSQRNIVNRKVWEELMAKNDNGEYIDAVGKEAVKGGLIADAGGVRAFVPASHLAQRFVEKIDQFVGQPLKLKIIDVNKEKKRIVASRKEVLREEAAKKKEEVWSKLEVGAVVKGIVRRFADFGAFVDLGGIDGLIHISELSWNHVNHPSEVVKVGQEVEVQVLDVDLNRERISLGLKQTTEDPWRTLVKKYPVGAIVEGQVTKLVTFGAFVDLGDGVEGLVHISEMARQHVDAPAQVCAVGDTVQVKVMEIDLDRRRISLSMKAAAETLGVEVEVKPMDKPEDEAAEEAPAEETAE